MNNDLNIKNKIDEMNKKINILSARSKIENLMGSYQYYYTAGNTQAITKELWAQNSHNATLEWCASGIFKGIKKISTFYEKDIIKGKLSVYTLNTPVIEIDIENNKAHAIWTAIGTETDAGELGENPPATLEEKALLTSKDNNGNAYRAEWVWQKYEGTFICENDNWKILNLHIYEIFRCPFDRDWVQYSVERFKTDGILIDSVFTSNLPFDLDGPPENNADEASSFHWQYKLNSLPQVRPTPPKEIN
ncbi:MAG: nuclear transport factor 2 family protein [Pleomorphochaeta sp.]